MALSLYLETHTLAFILLSSLAGLTVGSFLNVVIHRTPILLSRQWQRECQELAETPAQTSETYNLILPASHCPQCGHTITAWENIPIISFLWLKGKCAHCRAPISWRYPLVEILSATIAGVVAWHFGYTFAAAAMIVLSWALIALTFIDVDHQLLPDVITLPFLWLGLLLNTFDLLPYKGLESAVVGAAAGYLSLWLVFHIFKLITGKEGMGYGDFKLFALLGAWLGWQMLPVIILLASLAGAVVGITFILYAGRDRHLPIPFGPFLCAAGWVAALWGNDITSLYLQFARLSA